MNLLHISPPNDPCQWRKAAILVGIKHILATSHLPDEVVDDFTSKALLGGVNVDSTATAIARVTGNKLPSQIELTLAAIRVASREIGSAFAEIRESPTPDMKLADDLAEVANVLKRVLHRNMEHLMALANG